jgi:hypothetical protein
MTDIFDGKLDSIGSEYSQVFTGNLTKQEIEKAEEYEKFFAEHADELEIGELALKKSKDVARRKAMLLEALIFWIWV